jgi:DNA-binding response OmpR family regulator
MTLPTIAAMTDASPTNDFGEIFTLSGMLEGLKILVLEDEILIAMEVEQLCRDHGAKDVAIAGSLEEIGDKLDFNAAIIDLLLGGVLTFDFATRLKGAGTPFVFASGYTDNAEVAKRFPGIAMVGKPYSGNDLVEAVAAACGRVPASGGA